MHVHTSQVAHPRLRPKLRLSSPNHTFGALQGSFMLAHEGENLVWGKKSGGRISQVEKGMRETKGIFTTDCAGKERGRKSVAQAEVEGDKTTERRTKEL